MNKISSSKPLPDHDEIYDVIIIGGGLAGLISSISLSTAGFRILLLEKRIYPFHKVCGEYVSNEVIDYLATLGFNPFDFGASEITQLRISDPSGKNIYSKLDMGGFGLSRFKMDHELAYHAQKSNVLLQENCRVKDILIENNIFTVLTSLGNFKSRFVIGSYGKRDLLDKRLNRDFIYNRTRYMGVKYHVKLDYPINEIGLDNFPGGYCGIVKVEDEKYNLCYLYRNTKHEFKSIAELEEKILFSNPVIRNIFTKSNFISQTPEVINEISFDNKSCCENHIFLCGDAAGLITPLCGNGMAMAIHGSKLLTDILRRSAIPGKNPSIPERNNIEHSFRKVWKSAFSERLFWGRQLQKISGNPYVTSVALNLLHSIPLFEKWVIKKTHGKKLI